MAVITDLVAYWSLDEASGNAIDAHAANDLTDTNTVGTATGKVADARDFETSATEYFTLADNADMSLAGDTAFTVALWWKAETDPVSGGKALFAKSAGDDASAEYAAYFATGSPNISFRVGNGSSSAQVLSAESYGAIDNTNWHFGVFTHDPVANLLKIRIDDGTPTTAAWSGGTQDGANAFQLGAYTAWGVAWDGLLDEVGFWKKALTSGEETWLYNSGNGRSYADIVAEAGGGGNRRRRLLLCGA
jgi:hypothetical protein